MTKSAERLPSVRALVALAGTGALTACQCTDTQVNESRDVVARVFEHLDNLNAICAHDARMTIEGNQLKFTPQLRNPRGPISGPLRLTMTVESPRATASVPTAGTRPDYLELARDRRYNAGLTAIEEASLLLPRGGQVYIVKTTVWQPLFPRPAAEGPGDGGCHARESEHYDQG